MCPKMSVGVFELKNCILEFATEILKSKSEWKFSQNIKNVKKSGIASRKLAHSDKV